MPDLQRERPARTMPISREGEPIQGEGSPIAGASHTDGHKIAAPPRRKPLERVIAWSLRGSLPRVLLAVSVLFIAIFLLMAQTVVAQRQARQGVMLQDETMVSLNALMETMLDAETGQRGFLLTSNPTYLQPFEQAKIQLPAEVGALQRLSDRADDDWQRHIARAQQLIHDKIAELDRTVELARAGMMPAAMALVQTNVGQHDMTELRAELAWLRADQATQRRAAFDRVQALGNRLLPLVGLLGLGIVLLMIVAIRSERQRAWAEAEARQFAALRAANAESQLLARELNHRVKNLFSVILSIITVSARKPAPTAQVLADVRARVHALSLAHSSSQGLGLQESCDLADVINNIMRPYAEGSGTDDTSARVRLSGPAVNLPARMITPMGLLIHELATNGAKYGALSVASGVVDIAWDVLETPADGRNLQLTWIESGGPVLKDHAIAVAHDAGTRPVGGFGSRLTAMAAQQMGGSLDRKWPETGARIELICPLP